MDFLAKYRENIQKGLNGIEDRLYYAAVDVFHRLKESGNVLYTGGNGGSASIANHLVCDCSKGPGLGSNRRFRTHSLSCNAPVITAISNDIGYDSTLSFQLETYLKPNDAVLLISSSGKSPNIIKAATYCKQHGVMLIGLTGFSGGFLAELADINFHIPINNYGVVEDCHQSIMHILSQIYFSRGNYEF